MYSDPRSHNRMKHDKKRPILNLFLPLSGLSYNNSELNKSELYPYYKLLFLIQYNNETLRKFQYIYFMDYYSFSSAEFNGSGSAE